jgi:hypothetical protein
MFKTENLRQRVALARRTVNLGMSLAGDATVEPLHALDVGDALFNCANFLPYVLGVEARHGPNGESFFNAEHIYADATGQQTMFTRIEAPVPGCLIVVPANPGEDEFVGIITKTEPMMGISCNKSNLPEPIIEADFSHACSRPNRIYCVLTNDLQ